MTLAANVHRACKAKSCVRLFLSLFLFPIDHGLGHVDTLFQFAARDAITVGGDVPGLRGINAGDGQRIDAQLVSAHVDGLFHRPFGGRIAESAKGAGGNFVRVNEISLDFDVAVFVTSVMAHRRYTRDRRSFRRIGAIVRYNPEVLSTYAPIFLKAKRDVNLHENAGTASRQKFFFASIDDLDRLFCFAGEHRRHEGIVVVAGFSTEAATYGALDNAHIRFRYTQCRGDSQACAKQCLGVHVDRVFAVLRVFGDAADGLDGAVPLGRALKRLLDNQVGLRKSPRYIASFDIHRHGDVAFLVVVDQWRAVLHRFFSVKDPGQRLPFDVDEIKRLFGGICVNGSHRCDLFTDITALADRENILIGEKSAPRAFDGVFGGDHGAHAAQLFCAAGINANYSGVGVGATEYFPHQHPRQLNVGDIFRFTGDFVVAFDALDALADDRKWLWFCHKNTF